MARHKNVQWVMQQEPTWEAVHTALLMDIRDELQSLNVIFRCPNFTGIRAELRRITRQIKLQRRCPKHPRYTGRYEPTTDCKPCRRFWNAVWK